MRAFRFDVVFFLESESKKLNQISFWQQIPSQAHISSRLIFLSASEKAPDVFESVWPWRSDRQGKGAADEPLRTASFRCENF